MGSLRTACEHSRTSRQPCEKPAMEWEASGGCRCPGGAGACVGSALACRSCWTDPSLPLARQGSSQCIALHVTVTACTVLQPLLHVGRNFLVA
jgi:hypothetical protein